MLDQMVLRSSFESALKNKRNPNGHFTRDAPAEIALPRVIQCFGNCDKFRDVILALMALDHPA